MKNFDWNAFGKERNKIAVHCKTEEEAIDFCKQSHEHGYDWVNRENRAHNTHWSGYGEWSGYGNETCYSYDSYCDLNWYKGRGYKIVEWSDYMEKSFTKSDLKDGDVVLKRNGSVEIAIPSVGTFVCKDGYNSLSIFKEDLTSQIDSVCDILAVRRPNKPGDCQFDCFASGRGRLVFDRERDCKQPCEMTMEEICKALGKDIKIVKEKK